ncbi:pyruvate dehydrogenase complex dihydrolipoamide acetyltransferase [Akkermansiaceae bacterium]|jgi:pyruvate dehydrogenase E2 component (dihydrolipoamide acetyltransferase)|nr:pyruvate dehydrogenase complex dihydrolipoamide acetyltransferase [Akkermansiaceae bacterium]MDB4340987.1 pyruvate dehydrogenase complex dihydrolipoamide acetyltransferase [Akkermansiaceae bacterium]MDB4482392.1 pyruvate dehydrogenase complex dihydrolipoamide acetyltransferase [Akkermansiaceae bacterium]MDB4610724.1 pyruvate dehydrogenase complex dihydrolipoamide acetyltransferase [Akkermansiaceae bacterium]MDB4707756.1 pyruvate dehydrogenase complex dihydrolipoamide acetyltransferase [Akker
MPINIEMPKLSDTMTEGTVVRWLKKEGEEVEIGDIIAEIETDKATMEMEAFDEGILSKISVPEGGKAPVGSAIAILLEDGESEEATTPSAESAPAALPNTPPAAAKALESAAATVNKSQTPTPTPTDGERIKASPLAKKIAESEGVDLTAVSGTGPGGRIVKADVVAAPPASSPAPAPAAPPAPAVAPVPAAISPVAEGADQIVELSSMRKIIAERLLTSKISIPHFYLHLEVDAAPLMALRKQINAQSEASHGNKYSVNDFVVKALINASVTVPEANASFNGDHIVQFAHVGISVAIAVDDGLVTPVVKNAEQKSLLAISKEIKEMAIRARDKKLAPNEFDGGTVTISNLGAWGVESFDAIVNPPQAVILSVGGIIEKPVVKDGEIVPGLRMNLGVSCDHRVVDGAVGAKFLGEIKRLLENPALMLV